MTERKEAFDYRDCLCLLSFLYELMTHYESGEETPDATFIANNMVVLSNLVSIAFGFNVDQVNTDIVAHLTTHQDESCVPPGETVQ